MATFVPDELHVPKLDVPYFEDQSDKKIPGRGTSKSPQDIQAEIRELMTRLGAFRVVFTPGKFSDDPVRYGYQMTFMIANVPGRMEIAALPLESETAVKKDRALAQALYLVRNWLESEYFSQVYRPGSVPLLPYMVGSDNLTVTEAMAATGAIPLLEA